MDGSSFRDRSIDALIEDLRRAAAPVEGLFLDVGGHLATAAALLAPITDRFGALTGRLGEDDLLFSITCLETAAQGVESVGRNSTSGLGDLDRMDTVVSGIRSRSERLSKTIAEVRLLSVNARIESAHVANTSVDFSVFTHGIGRLATLAEQGLSELSAELSALASLVTTARREQRSFEQAHRESLEAVGDRVGNSLASSETHRSEIVSPRVV